MSDIDIGGSDRAAFIGNTGSGKTTLVQSLLVGHDSVVVIDSKHDPKDWGAFAQQHGYVVTADPADIRRHAKVIFQVRTNSLEDRAGWRKEGTEGAIWSEALASIFWRQPPGHGGSTLTVFDEAMHVLPSTRPSHPEARRLSTQGRALGLPVWLGSQALLYVDTVMLSMCEHLFSFAQPIEEYRDLIRKRRGVDTTVLGTLRSQQLEHVAEFAHHRLGSPGWSICDPVQPVTRVTNAPLSRVPISEAPAPSSDFVALTAPEPA